MANHNNAPVRISGHCADLTLRDCCVTIVGMVDNLYCTNCDIKNAGTIKLKSLIVNKTNTQTVYRDRIVEVEKPVYRDKIVYRDRPVPFAPPEPIDTWRDRVDALLEVNRAQAQRIAELERIIDEGREGKTEDPWLSQKPTKADCARVLKQLNIYMDYEDYSPTPEY